MGTGTGETVGVAAVVTADTPVMAAMARGMRNFILRSGDGVLCRRRSEVDGLKEDRRNRGGTGYMIYHGKQRSRDSANTDGRPGDGCGLISILACWVFLTVAWSY